MGDCSAAVLIYRATGVVWVVKIDKVIDPMQAVYVHLLSEYCVGKLSHHVGTFTAATASSHASKSLLKFRNNTHLLRQLLHDQKDFASQQRAPFGRQKTILAEAG